MKLSIQYIFNHSFFSCKINFYYSVRFHWFLCKIKLVIFFTFLEYYILLNIINLINIESRFSCYSIYILRVSISMHLERTNDRKWKRASYRFPLVFLVRETSRDSEPQNWEPETSDFNLSSPVACLAVKLTSESMRQTILVFFPLLIII